MTIEDVDKLAELARIELSGEEKTSLLRDFDSILAYVDTVKSAVTEEEDVKPDTRNVWREDRPEPREFSLDSIVEQFPDSQPARPHESSGAGGGVFLKVKKIM